jgi:ABC-type multidrug transport system ATPase subunit
LAPEGSRAMSAPVIEVRNVTKTYRLGDIEIPALHGIDLKVEQGEFVALMGAPRARANRR